MKALIDYITKKILPEDEKLKAEVMQCTSNKTRDFYVVDGILYTQEKSDHHDKYYTEKIVIPNNDILKSTIMNELHNSKLAGHLGVAKTSARIKLTFYWPNMDNDIRDWIHNCVPCQVAKGNHSGDVVAKNTMITQGKDQTLVPEPLHIL